MINSRTDKCVSNDGKDSGGHKLVNSPKASQAEVGALELGWRCHLEK